MKELYYKKAVVLTLFFLFIGTLISPTIMGITKTEEKPEPLNSEDWWTMCRHDAANTGCSTSEAPNTNQLNWYYDTYEELGMSSAAIYENNVIVVTGNYYDKDYLKNISEMLSTPSEKTAIIDILKNKIENIDDQYIGSIYCLDAGNGTIKWARQLSLPTDPVVHDNKVYVTTIDLYSYSSYIYCLDLNTGNIIWQQPLSGWILSSMVLYENKLYAGLIDLYSYAGKLFCLDASTGSIIWTKSFGVYEFLWYTSPAVAEGKVLVVPMNVWYYYDISTLYCLDATSGDFVWAKTLYGFPFYASPIIADGRIFLTVMDLYSYSGALYCFDILTGNTIWMYNLPNSFTVSGSAVNDNEIFVPAMNSYTGIPSMSCIDIASGTLIWHTSFEDQPHGTWLSAPSYADEKIYFTCDYSGDLLCVNANNGSKRWGFTLAYDSLSSPSIADGQVIVGDFNGRIYAFEDVLKIDKISGGLFSVKANILNEGAADIPNIDWEIAVQGGLLGFINKTVNGTISTLSGESSLKIQTSPLFGLGSINITVTLQTNEISPFSKKTTAFILGPIIIIR